MRLWFWRPKPHEVTTISRADLEFADLLRVQVSGNLRPKLALPPGVIEIPEWLSSTGARWWAPGRSVGALVVDSPYDGPVVIGFGSWENP